MFGGLCVVAAVEEKHTHAAGVLLLAGVEGGRAEGRQASQWLLCIPVMQLGLSRVKAVIGTGGYRVLGQDACRWLPATFGQRPAGKFQRRLQACWRPVR